jgi:hypothetical protein
LERLGYVYVEGTGRSKVVCLASRPEYEKELAAAREAVGMVETLARAWGVPTPKLGEEIPDRPPALRQGGGGVSEVG